MIAVSQQLAQWASEAAREAGAEVHLVKVHELAPEVAINNNPAWKAQLHFNCIFIN